MNSGNLRVFSLSLVAAALLMSVTSSTLAEGSRRALIIGINKYEIAGRTLSRGEPQVPLKWLDLQGAVNDAHRMRDLLVSRYGFKHDDIVMLKDGEATRQAIMDAMNRQLVAPAKRGDLAFFYFAGHGSRVRNTLGEDDKLDETIVPADVMTGVRDIRDKEVRDVFNKVLDKGAQMVAVFDSCHSGSVSRGLAGDAPYRTRLLPIDPRDVKDGSKAQPPWERGAVILSAAQDSELASEDHDEFNNAGGRFSIAFAKVARSAPVDEPVQLLFRRVQGAMRNRGTDQEPALEATEARRKQPLLGGSAAVIAGGVTAAVQQIDGATITLQEGLGAGLTVGSELTHVSNQKVRLQLERVEGISRSYARVVAGAAESIHPGDLFVVSKAAAPDVPNLRVWVPTSNLSAAELTSLHEAVRSAVTAKGYKWVVDPVKQKPTYVIQYADAKWSLWGSSGEPQGLGPNLAATAVAGRLPAPASQSEGVYLMLPVFAELDSQLVLGRETTNNAIERGDRLNSDYYLMGSVDSGALKYSWVRPWLGAAQASTLPMRTDWVATPAATAGNQLTALALKLGFINAWLTIEGSTTGQPFPYRLVLRESASGRHVDEGQVVDGQAFELALVSDRQNISPQVWRFVYVYVIDSEGKMTLLFPRAGAVENRFPFEQDAKPPQSYVLDHSGFQVSEPFGTDTYVLITSSEQFSEPGMLQSSGVITSRSAESTLSALLRGIGASSRGATPQPIPSRWSIDRISVQSVPKPQ